MDEHGSQHWGEFIYALERLMPVISPVTRGSSSRAKCLESPLHPPEFLKSLI